MNISVNEDEGDNDEIKELAKQRFKRDHPDRVWGVQATGPVQGVITQREIQIYLKWAKDKIEGEKMFEYGELELVIAPDEERTMELVRDTVDSAKAADVSVSYRVQFNDSAAHSDLPSVAALIAEVTPLVKGALLVWLGHWLSRKSGRKVTTVVEGVTIEAGSVAELECMMARVRSSSFHSSETD